MLSPSRTQCVATDVAVAVAAGAESRCCCGGGERADEEEDADEVDDDDDVEEKKDDDDDDAVRGASALPLRLSLLPPLPLLLLLPEA